MNEYGLFAMWSMLVIGFVILIAKLDTIIRLLEQEARDGNHCADELRETLQSDDAVSSNQPKPPVD